MQALHTLRHPNIISYYGAWVEDNHCYILMEYATRCTLKDLLEKRQTALKEEVSNDCLLKIKLSDKIFLYSQTPKVILNVKSLNIKIKVLIGYMIKISYHLFLLLLFYFYHNHYF